MNIPDPFEKIWFIPLAIWIYLSFEYVSIFTISGLIMVSLIVTSFKALIEDKKEKKEDNIDRKDPINYTIGNHKKLFVLALFLFFTLIFSVSSMVHFSLIEYSITNHILLILSIISLLYLSIGLSLLIKRSEKDYLAETMKSSKNKTLLFSLISFLIFIFFSGLFFWIIRLFY